MTTNVLIVPGYHGSGDAHWQRWLQARLPQARCVTGIDWEVPALHRWADAIKRDLDRAPYPGVIVAHSFGCLATALAIAHRPRRVAGVILVAPADPERFQLSGPRDSDQTSIARFLPETSLDTYGLVVGSRNDPWMKLHHAYAWAKRWQLLFHDAGAVGHINVDTSFGPWPWIQQVTEALCEKIALTDVDAPIEYWSSQREIGGEHTPTTGLFYA